jgi:hypothetical protein
MNVEASASPGAERSLPSLPDGGAPERRAPRAVIIGRLLMLLGAAAALASGLERARTYDRAAAATLGLYVCPMHAEIVSSVPGDCPICNMALVPRHDGLTKAVADDGEITAPVERRFVAQQVRAAAWLETDHEGTAVLYKDDLVALGAREPATFLRNSAPNVGVTAHLLLESQSPIDASTVHVRFRLDEAASWSGTPRGASDVGSLQIAIRARELLVVPRSAVLYSAMGPYVLAASQPGEAFIRRSVQVGRILDSGYVGDRTGTDLTGVVVLSGLREGERVISGYTFFVDVERRLREGRASGEEGMR